MCVHVCVCANPLQNVPTPYIEARGHSIAQSPEDIYEMEDSGVCVCVCVWCVCMCGVCACVVCGVCVYIHTSCASCSGQYQSHFPSLRRARGYLRDAR